MSTRLKFATYLGLILMSTVMVVAFVFLVTTVATRAAEADKPGRTIFEAKCQGCHSIGGGRLVGPDLDDVTTRRDRDWLISFIASPDQLIGQGDSLALELIKEYVIIMPNLGVSDQEAEEVLVYIEAQSGSQAASPQEEEEPTPVVEEQPTLVTTDTTGDAAKGRDIFTGSRSLKNSGAACISCHNVDGIAALGGGAVAKDLTGAYSNYGEAGLTAILKTVPFPLMKVIYEDRPLEDDEVVNLMAFFEETADAQQPGTGQNALTFLIIGLAGLLPIVIILQFTWRGRLAGVRRTLVKGGSK